MSVSELLCEVTTPIRRCFGRKLCVKTADWKALRVLMCDHREGEQIRYSSVSLAWVQQHRNLTFL